MYNSTTGTDFFKSIELFHLTVNYNLVDKIRLAYHFSTLFTCTVYITFGFTAVLKTCEVFLCFLAITCTFLGSIVLTSLWLPCIHCFMSLVSFTGFYTEDKPHFQ